MKKFIGFSFSVALAALCACVALPPPADPGTDQDAAAQTQPHVTPPPADPGTTPDAPSDPLPPPVPPVPPVPEPPPEPAPDPLPPVAEIMPRSLHVFCEAGDAAGKDFFFKAAGLPRERCFAHAIRGRSAQAQTIRLAHVWYEPWKTAPADVDLAAKVKAWVGQAKREGCAGVSLDHEGWAISKGIRLLTLMHDEANAAGMPFIVVPKAAFEHVIVHHEADDWAWPFRFGTSPAKCAELISDATDAALFWNYEADTTDWAYDTAYARRLGYAKQQICMVDGLSTRTRPKNAAVLIDGILSGQSSIGVFNPDVAAPEVIEAIRKRLK